MTTVETEGTRQQNHYHRASNTLPVLFYNIYDIKSLGNVTISNLSLNKINRNISGGICTAYQHTPDHEGKPSFPLRYSK